MANTRCWGGLTFAVTDNEVAFVAAVSTEVAQRFIVYRALVVVRALRTHTDHSALTTTQLAPSAPHSNPPGNRRTHTGSATASLQHRHLYASDTLAERDGQEVSAEQLL